MTINTFPFGSTFNGFSTFPYGHNWNSWGGNVPFGYTGNTGFNAGFQNWNTPFSNWSNHVPFQNFNGFNSTPYTTPFNWFNNFNSWNTTPFQGFTGFNGSMPWNWNTTTPWNYNWNATTPWNSSNTFGGFSNGFNSTPYNWNVPFSSTTPFNYGYTPFGVPFGYTFPNFWNGTVPFVGATPVTTPPGTNVTPTTIGEQTTTGNRVVYPFPFGGFNPFVYVGPQGIVNGTPVTQAA